MSAGFIVCKGLGSPLSVPNGFGSITEESIDGAVIQFETGGLRIHVHKFNNGVMVVFDDGDNYVNRWFSLTTEQLAGNAWMIVNVSRSGATLSLSVDRSEPQTATLATPIKTYGGKVTIMRQKSGKIFDVRAVQKSTGKDHVDYYIDDIEENEGKAMLP